MRDRGYRSLDPSTARYFHRRKRRHYPLAVRRRVRTMQSIRGGVMNPLYLKIREKLG